jgi:AmmeMemoRadiSam system protein A
LSPDEAAQLLALAHESIQKGLRDERLCLEVSRYTAALQAIRASFVTLKIAGELRGCIGAIEARRALVADVMEHAHGAAFGDPRFPPLSRREYGQIALHISILSVPRPLRVESEGALLAQLRIGVDGLVLQEGARRATFLPSVWESVSDPSTFVRLLKRKAGLPADYWSPTLRIARYTVEHIQ